MGKMTSTGTVLIVDILVRICKDLNNNKNDNNNNNNRNTF